MLEQVADILAAQDPEQVSATRGDERELEIDERRPPVRCHEPVRLLGQVVVRHTARVQPAQQMQSLAVVLRVGGACELHGLPLDPGSFDLAPRRAQQSGDAVEACEGLECPALAAGQMPRQPGQPPARRAGVAHDPFLALRGFEQRHGAEEILLEEGHPVSAQGSPNSVGSTPDPAASRAATTST